MQLCFMAALTAAATTEATVLYIDTLNSFSPARLAEIFRRNPLFSHRTDVEHVLSKIRCVHVHDIFQMIDTLEGFLQDVADEGGRSRLTKLVVIDSVASVVSPTLAGVGLFLGHGLMTSLGRILKVLAVEHNTAVLMTNYVVSGGPFAPGEAKPALGPSWTYTSHIQLFLSIRASDSLSTKRLVECRKTPRV